MRMPTCRWVGAVIGLTLTAPQCRAQTVYTPYTFTTLAGDGLTGSNDGPASAAHFYFPASAVVDSLGNVYVADSENSTIRKMTPAGAVTTLAGLARSYGSTDGTGSAARFDHPYGVAVDNAGDLYVADTRNHTIRKVTPDGIVTTLAGQAQQAGSADGFGGAARFQGPLRLAADNAGNIYVADSGNHLIRKVTATGTVTTVAGLAGNSGSADGTGDAARFNYPEDVAVDAAGNLYVADSFNAAIRKVTPVWQNTKAGPTG